MLEYLKRRDLREAVLVVIDILDGSLCNNVEDKVSEISFNALLCIVAVAFGHHCGRLESDGGVGIVARNVGYGAQILHLSLSKSIFRG